MNKRSAQKSQSRENLLRVAYEEFSKQGILKTSTLQIARTAKMAHGSIFAHFPNRDALVIAVIDAFGRRLAEAMHQSMEKSKGVKELLEAHIQALQEFENFYTYLVIEAPLLSDEIRYAAFYIQSGFASFLEKKLQQEMERGNAKSIPLPLLLNTWLGLLHYYLSHKEKFATGSSVLKEQGPALVAFMIDYIISPKD